MTKLWLALWGQTSMVCEIIIIRDYVDFMLYQFEYIADERSWVMNPGEWLFILKLVPDEEITVKLPMKRLLSWKQTDFEWLCLKGKCNYDQKKKKENKSTAKCLSIHSVLVWTVGQLEMEKIPKAVYTTGWMPRPVGHAFTHLARIWAE